MALGYFADVADADDYFADERLETRAWDALATFSSSGTNLKEKCLIHSFNRIFYSPLFSLPTYAAATPAELVILRKAHGEMAYYVALHIYGEDEDRRKGLQYQAVTDAGIVEEKYDKERYANTPIPAPVIDMLAPWSTDAHRVFAANLDRDEDKDITEKLDLEFF